MQNRICKLFLQHFTVKVLQCYFTFSPVMQLLQTRRLLLLLLLLPLALPRPQTWGTGHAAQGDGAIETVVDVVVEEIDSRG
jgi:hypothetical protein